MVSHELGGVNVVCYFSSFLSSKRVLNYGISGNDINGFMNAFAGMDCSKGLALILNTPGGEIYATETIVEYLHNKFDHVTAIIPLMSMSAGTLIALSCDKIIISRAGQLGPVDTQMRVGGQQYSVKDLIKQFETAREDILKSSAAYYVWRPILEAYAPARYQQALQENSRSKQMLNKWLSRKGKTRQERQKIIRLFHDAPKVHSKRIDYEDMTSRGLEVAWLEDNQELQEAALSVYHFVSILGSRFSIAKMVITSNGRVWYENELRQSS